MGRMHGQIRGMFVALAFLCGISVAAGPGTGAQAASDTDRIFEIRGVPVDVAATTAAAARDEAILQGRRAAWQRLVARLVPQTPGNAPPSSGNDLPDDNTPGDSVPGDDMLADLTVGYEVARERTSDVRYIGLLNFSFNPVAVRGYFAAEGIAYAEIASRPTLVLPLYNDGQRPLLWEEENPWFGVWLRQDSGGGLVPVLVPHGDLPDIRDISAVQALLADRPAIEAIAARYGAAQTVIAGARRITLADGTPAVALNLAYIGGVADGRTLVRTVTQNPAIQDGETQDTGTQDTGLLSAAARVTTEEIQEAWKAENLVDPGLETRVTMLAPLSSFDAWLAVRAGLDGISSVSRRELRRLSRTEALLDVWIRGDAARLALALKQKDYILEEWQDTWLLYRQGEELPARYREPPLQPAGPPVSAPAPALQPPPDQKTDGQAPPVLPVFLP